MRYFLLIILIGTSLQLGAQCEDKYFQALEDFENGKLEEVISGISECAQDKDLPRPVRRRMLDLVVRTYQFLDDGENALATYKELLRVDPFYQLDENIPELKYLAHKIETYPLTSYSFSSGINFFSLPIVENEFSPSGVTVSNLNYNRESDDLFGWSIGAGFSINIFESNLDFGIGYYLSTYYYRYNATLENAVLPDGTRGDAFITFQERHRWSEIPFTLTWNFVKRDLFLRRRIIPFVYAGVATNLLNKESAEFVGPTITFDDLEDNISDSQIEIGSLREEVNPTLLAGGGIKVNFKRLFLMLNVKYSRFLSNHVKSESRFSNTDLIETYNYADDDFKLHTLGVQVGAGLFLYRTRLKDVPIN